jgi:hypothetical protein
MRTATVNRPVSLAFFPRAIAAQKPQTQKQTSFVTVLLRALAACVA